MTQRNSQIDKARRAENYRYALNSVGLEGVELSEEMKALGQRYISGEITLQEHTKLGLAQLKKERAQKEKPALVKKAS